MDRIIEENNKIIKQIQNMIDEMQLSEFEEQIIEYINFIKENMSEDDVKIENKLQDDINCRERKIYFLINKINYFLERIEAVNGIIFGEDKVISRKIQNIYNIQSIPCNIACRADLNNQRYYVAMLFYKKILNNHQYNIFNLVSINSFGNILRYDVMTQYEQSVACELNTYLEYKKIEKCFNELINICLFKNFIYNKNM